MQRLSPLQTIIMLVGGLLLVAGTGCYVFLFHQQIACWVALAGALAFSLVQMCQRYEGANFVVRRLRRIMLLADVLFVVAALMMIESSYGFLKQYFTDPHGYYTWLYNKWIIALLVAALLEIYTTHRIDHELRKNNTPKEQDE